MSKTPERELSAEETTAGASGAVQDSPYHRSPEEMAKLPTIESTMTVCPECKLIIEGTIYKDGDNVMIRKYCPEHDWTVEKYWEDYDMYMTHAEVTTTPAGDSTTPTSSPARRGPTARSTADSARGTSPTRRWLTSSSQTCATCRCWYCFFYAKEGDERIPAIP